MKLDDYLEKYSDKLNYLQELFIKNIFHKDYGDKGLDLIVPEYQIDREDGSERSFFIDFIVQGGEEKKYAIELHGFHAHDQAGRYVTNERFNELQIKNNLIREKFDKYIEVTKTQIESRTEAIYQLRRSFKSDQSLYDLYLNRDLGIISPNEVQKDALVSISNAREIGKKSGLVILATGLGKTFLSGFDIQLADAKKVLFIAHVGEILRKTKNDFEDLMNNRVDEMVMFSSDTKNEDGNIFFATIQSIHKPKNLEKFATDFFDYIVIDEAHHVAASTYQKVINYFNPRFLLGLTATPFRSDEQNIVSSFDNNILFQMDQEQAINQGYLADIKYLGFYDDVDYSDIRWNGSKYDLDDLNKKLMIEERDLAIIAKYQETSESKEKTIGFCTSIEHADYMANTFNKKGIKSVAIHSRSETSRSRFSTDERDSLLERFRKDEFEVAFTVNMFNEGVDIPDVSSILMLRPTDSLTIFIQQIGRGLRLSSNKEHLKVLDFIGNYRTADVTLGGLNIEPGDLIYDPEKDIYYYDNQGKSITFDAKIIDIFKALISKKSAEVDLEEIDKNWLDYAEFLNNSTQTDEKRNNSVSHYWQVDKKKKDIKAHLWAIDFYLTNIHNYENLTELNNDLRKKAQVNNIIIEGTRALFFSKLLGLITTDSPFQGTGALQKIKDHPQTQSLVISQQMEKLFFWNDIYSPINRHATQSDLRRKEANFSIYTIIYIYQVMAGLYFLDQKVFLSKFELEYFVFFSRSHDQLNETIENIITYRKSKNIYELQKLLKQSVRSNIADGKYNIFDTRYFSILKHVEYFLWNKDSIKIKNEYLPDMLVKVSKFEEILEKNMIFPDGHYDEYKEMLYSNKNIFDYHLK